jgi:hypothetical protein
MSVPTRQVARATWREHAVALLIYALLAVALSWPLPRLLTSQIVGEGGDPIHHLWLIWHTREALLGREPWFAAPLLYYPQGITLLTHGLGPVMGILALPFWPLGTLAAHNGALLVALWLTGYAMYLLGRSLGFGHGVALFGGVALISAPMCVGGLRGHMTKVFLAGPPRRTGAGASRSPRCGCAPCGHSRSAWN